MTTPTSDTHAAGHDDSHAPFLAHHFDTPEQQLAAGKLGMWLFLVTEVLLFGGLFCAYAVYRAHHPEIFQYAAEEFLDKSLGALNTAVLIFSSFTMAWAVRCAQLNQQRALVILLSITIACGFVFLGVKYVEYKHKWEEGLLWAKQFHPVEHGAHGDTSEHEGAESKATDTSAKPPESVPPAESGDTHTATESPAADAESEPTEQLAPSASRVDHVTTIVSRRAGDASHGAKFRTQPENVGVFFSIYFAMTGLHGLHVIAGMLAIGWVLNRALRGHFSHEYYGPVDFVGLYWHLVDLIWIYLFPLLYLIH